MLRMLTPVRDGNDDPCPKRRYYWWSIGLWIALLVATPLLSTGVPTADPRTDTAHANTQPLFIQEAETTTIAGGQAVAWGDYDQDGDLDLAIGADFGTSNRIYRNDDGQLTLVWEASSTEDDTRDLAWGDLNNDGYLELVAVGRSFIRAYQNQTGTLDGSLTWSLADNTKTFTDVALADYNSDGALDITVALLGDRDPVDTDLILLYANNRDGTFTFTQDLLAGFIITIALAWADYDSDGDPDLAAGTNQGLAGEPTGIYLFDNVNGTLSDQTTPLVELRDCCADLAWGDMDSDGNPDLVGIGNTHAIYRNNGDGTFAGTPAWQSQEPQLATTGALGDYDSDGDPDILFGTNGNNTIYRNNGLQGQALQFELAWSELTSRDTRDVAWADYDRDGDLDIASVNTDPSLLVRLRSEVPQIWLEPARAQAETISDSSSRGRVAWGDYDNDGDLDLATATFNSSDNNLRVFRNDDGQLTQVWAASRENPRSVAWGDVDGDRVLELAVTQSLKESVGVSDQVWQLTDIDANNQPTFTPIWERPGGEGTPAADAAWGDYDQDGDLDLLIATFRNEPAQLYRNDGLDANQLTLTLVWEADIPQEDNAVAWADIDNDSDLDFVIGTANGNLTAMRNDGIQPDDTPLLTVAWETTEGSVTDVVPVDYDGDGDMDLLAVLGGEVVVYETVAGQLFTERTLLLSLSTLPTNLAVHDYDGDRDLDIAVGGTTARLYQNNFGTFTQVWESTNPVLIEHLEWGDVDQDGDQDLVLASLGFPDEFQVYRNRRNDSVPPAALPKLSVLQPDNQPAANGYATPILLESEAVTIPFRLFSPTGQPAQITEALYSMDGGGTWFPAATPDATLPSDLETVRTVQQSAAQPLASGDALTDQLTFGGLASVRDPEVTLTFDLLTASSLTAQLVAPWPNPGNPTVITLFQDLAVNTTEPVTITFSDGAAFPVSVTNPFATGKFQPVAALGQLNGMPADTPLELRLAGSGQSGTLTSWTLRDATPAIHSFVWDLFASGVFGQSDNVLVRLEAAPGTQTAPANAATDFQYSTVVAQTTPFRVRGTQVRVVDAQGNGIPNALVYRLPADQEIGGDLITSATDVLVTNSQGYLGGQGQLAVGDQLFALAPIASASAEEDEIPLPYTLYHTNGAPTEDGLNVFTVNQPGLQELVVSAENPLLLFDLDVSVEWDLTADVVYQQRLIDDILLASEYLYDWSNGRVALGDIVISQNADNWLFSHITVHADNSIRPFAAQGGIVTDSTPDPQVSNVIYEPGQITMGSSWNRYGDAGANLENDWPLTLAHELGHYLFFLDDVYLGLDLQGNLIAVDSCVGSPMGDVYTAPNNAEYYWDANSWDANCVETLTNRTLNRTEWATIVLWYAALNEPTTDNFGPNTMPFNLTSVTLEDPITSTNVLADPTFRLQYGGTGNPVASNQATVYRQRDLDGDGSYDFIVAQGSPSGTQNRIKVHGAAPGDRLCAFDPLRQQFGCEVVTVGDDQLQLRRAPNWQPVLSVTPVNSTTFTLNVTGVEPGGAELRARIYPEYGTPPASVNLRPSTEGYTGTLELDDVSFYGHIQLWVAEPATETNPRRETVIAYSVGGNPGKARSGTTSTRGGGGKARSGTTGQRGGGGKARSGTTGQRGGPGKARSGTASLRAGNSPVASSDGKFIFYTENPIIFDEGDYYVIQTMNRLPAIPPGRTPIGVGYNLLAAPETDPSVLTGSSVSFEYRGTDIIAAQATEQNLRIGFWDGQTWEQLTTVIDPEYNLASAPSRGPGVYALFATIETNLVVGWNQFSYLVTTDQEVAAALGSIDGNYDRVYYYDRTDITDPWAVYNPAWPSWVNDLVTLSFGEVYFIRMREAATLYQSPDPGAVQTDQEDTGTDLVPPTTLYGTVAGDDTWSPAANQVVEVWAAGQLCATGTTRLVEEQVVYVLDVPAVCGTVGAVLTFRIDGVVMAPQGVWDNTRGGELNLGPDPIPESTPTPTPTASATPTPTSTPDTPITDPDQDERVFVPLVQH